MTTWLITGANGNLGRRLIAELLQDTENEIRAVVRSERSAQTIRDVPLPDGASDRLSIHTLAYTDSESLTAVAGGADVAVHLVGILKEGSTSSYEDAHERSCEALAQAGSAAGIAHITYLSIVGSTPESSNACLRSKGTAELVLKESAVSTAVIRVPMVLGEGDYASKALYYRALKGLSFTFRAASLEQPLYAGDVVAAIVRAAEGRISASLDLGGPEVLSRRALAERAAASLGKSTRVLSLPVGLGMALAWLMTKLSANPPLTPAMLGVLDHDDEVDSGIALERLGLSELTSVDAMLERVLTP